MQVDELSKVLVYRDEDPVLRPCQFQKSPVPRIRAKGLRFKSVVSDAAKPLSQPASCAPIHDESHDPATETGASVSPAITVWA